MANLKNITNLPVAESAEGLNLIVNDNGSAKQIASSAVGAQADFSVTDETNPAFIKNKPFYDTREYEKITLTFDGDMTGKETVELEAGATYAVKLSDKTPTQEELIGGFAFLVNNGESSGTEITNDTLYNIDGSSFMAGDSFLVVPTELTLNGLTYSSGIWAMCGLSSGTPILYGSELSWTGLVSGELKQLDAKYVAGLEELRADFDALASSVVSVYSGTAEPTADVGEDGDVYLVTEG